MIHLLWYIPMCGVIMAILFWRRNKIVPVFTVSDMIWTIVIGLFPVLNVFSVFMILAIEIYELEFWSKEL